MSDFSGHPNNYQGYGYDHDVGSFEQMYRCYPSSLINKPHVESGDKIIMPQSALDCLAFLHIDFPMLFELHNPATNRVSHCGVLEFIADEGMIYLPHWMMENMLLQEGNIVKVKNATLQKGTYLKLQPHSKEFLDISNPKAILEMTLRNYSCLTTGDTIMVSYNNKKYYIDIIETKPTNAVSIIETDCEVDFAPPLDYKEPERPTTSSKAPSQDQEEPVKEEPRIIPFSGVGRRLDGMSSKPVSASVWKEHQSEAPNVKGQTSSGTSSRKHSGRLLFGSDANQVPKETQKAAAREHRGTNSEPQKKEEPKFQPFTGKKYTLNG
ncbi:hypothetical protein AAC387_Pa09g1645 [Persea americana]